MKIACAVLILTLVNIWSGFSQIKHYQRFGVEDGLLTNRLTSVTEGPDGFIWITTNGSGVTRFDGLNFEHFNENELIGSPYYFSSVKVNNAIWFGGEDYLCVYRDQVFQKIAIPNVGAILQLVYWQDSILFCISDHTAFLYDMNAGLVNEMSINGTHFRQAEVLDNVLWVAGDTGIWCYKDKKWDRVYPKDPTQAVSCSRIFSINGSIYFLSDREGIMQIQDSEIRRRLSPGDLPSGNITFIKGGSLDNIYFGTIDSGIQIWQLLDSLWLGIDEKELGYPQVTDMIFDRWENAWVTSEGGGLIKFYTESFNIYPPAGLSGKSIDFMETWSDTVVIHYRNDRCDIILPGQYHPVPFDLTGHEIKISAVIDSFAFSFSSDKVFVGIKDSIKYTLDIPGLKIGEEFEDIYQVDSSTFLASTGFAVYRLKIGISDSIPYVTPIYLLRMPVQSTMRHPQGFWLLGNNWVGILRDSVVEAHTYLDHPLFMLPVTAKDILIGTRNALYFAQDFEGAIQLSQVTTSMSLTNIRSAFLDKRGFLWISLQNKLLQCRIDFSRPLEVLKVYDQTSGLPRLEFLEGSLLEGPGERIYAGTSSGLLEIVPEQNFQSVEGPVISLVQFEAGNNQYVHLNDTILSELKHIKPGNADVTIALRAIDLRSPQKIRYFYRLIPREHEWVESRSGGFFQFYGLPAGRYRFEAKAININDRVSNQLQIPFTILTPFYFRWWFVGIGLFSVMGGSYLIYRKRLRWQLKKNQQYQDALERENKMLHLEQSAGRLQMNPHFIFNALQSIQSSISTGDRDKARADLQIFSKLMRSYLEHARVEKITLEDEIKLLDQYLTVERQLKGDRFSYEITLAAGIDSSFVEIPTMLLQPFVENAIKHGQPGGGVKGRIQVYFEWHGKYLCCTISDNGPGMSDSVSPHKSAGMDITRQRLETYFKHQLIDPLKIETGQSGTKIRILLPVDI